MGASFGFGANYSNTVGLTYATLGAGNLNVRDRPLLDISTLNRTPTSMQRVIRRNGWSFQIPTFSWLELGTQLQNAIRFISALTAEIPDDTRREGAQAVDQFHDLILKGASREEAVAIEYAGFDSPGQRDGRQTAVGREWLAGGVGCHIQDCRDGGACDRFN